MRKILALATLMLVLSACDDGDIVVTDFQIENAELQVCGTQQKVIYAVNNDGVYESLSLTIDASQNNAISVENGELILEASNEPYVFDLTGNNRLTYRIYDSPISNEYFCSNIPPRSPRVLQEFTSRGGGTISIRVAYTDIGPNADTDGDGIPNSEEGYDANLSDSEMQDTDGDGIPDYLDIDDDGDNVLTRDEINPEEGSWEEFGFLDTDGDGTPDYLDPDDDGDGVPTRNEVDISDLSELGENDWLRPTIYAFQEGIPDYLNPNYSARNNENPTYVQNIISRSLRTTITITGFSLEDANGNAPDINTNNNFQFGTIERNNVEVLLLGNNNNEEQEEQDEIEG